MSVERQREDLLRRLALNDETTLQSILGPGVGEPETSELGAKTSALVRLGALVATESADASYQWAVGVALATGASEEEIVDVVLAVAPIVGVARVNSAAAGVAQALGYEPDVSDIR
jgi:4-carboxymuconolactone decarboxylase